MTPSSTPAADRIQADADIAKARIGLRHAIAADDAAARVHDRAARDRAAEHARQRPARWAALPLHARAAIKVADELPRTVSAGFRRFANLLQEGETSAALSSPPASFERDQ